LARLVWCGHFIFFNRAHRVIDGVEKMAFFGDTLSHAALLGVALAFWLRISPHAGVFIISMVLALLIAVAQRQKTLAIDTILGITAHSSLALGIIIASLVQSIRINLESFLFGDILAIGRYDALWLFGFACALLPIWIYLWPTLVLGAVSRDLAKVEGAPLELAEHLFSFLLRCSLPLPLISLACYF